MTRPSLPLMPFSFPSACLRSVSVLPLLAATFPFIPLSCKVCVSVRTCTVHINMCTSNPVWNRIHRSNQDTSAKHWSIIIGRNCAKPARWRKSRPFRNSKTWTTDSCSCSVWLAPRRRIRLSHVVTFFPPPVGSSLPGMMEANEVETQPRSCGGVGGRRKKKTGEQVKVKSVTAGNVGSRKFDRQVTEPRVEDEHPQVQQPSTPSWAISLAALQSSYIAVIRHIEQDVNTHWLNQFKKCFL